ncbi:MAG: iron-containing alcohol dehydrogenase [Spirochaetes bacterium]|nr:iron-containing alcohol dehydrogenase [Spirochaetota bacterium]
MDTSFSFILPTRIEYGAGIHKQLPKFLEELGSRKILIITDPGVSRLDWFTHTVDLLNAQKVKVEVYNGVEPNPKDRNVEEAAKVAQRIQADCLLAIGGGSPIDCAKVVSILAVYGGKARDYEDRSRIGPQPLPIIAVPTTAGTGSEVTFGAVITDTEAKFKFTVKSPLIAPKVALLDPDLTLSMPPALTASTGMDALTHAIEAYTSRVAEPISDACALHAAELISAYLPRAVRNGSDREARAALLTGSLLAGIAFSHSDVGAVHCIAEALGGMYDLPHGVCNAVCLPYIMEYCLEANQARYARLAEALTRSFPPSSVPIGDIPKAAQESVRLVRQLARDVGLPSFRSFHVPEADFPRIAEKSSANGSNKDNVPVLTKEDYLHLLRSMQTG